ncbi:MAG: DUF1569 domain-containing protein [Phycisphaerae bacterium]|nr:DUF1569 domain-containing protein [Phycisphaerae bacterium]
MVRTRRVKDRRRLRFETVDDCIAEIDRIVVADSRGTLRKLGNWSPGQAFGHLASWIEYGWTGYPPMRKPPIVVRWLVPIVARRFARRGLPVGVHIPGVKGGTYGMEELETSVGAERLKMALVRLKAGEEARYQSVVIGPLTMDERIQLNLRHAELHLSFLVPS